jgi:RNA polymerase sigma-70 factor (ECF subfamily)
MPITVDSTEVGPKLAEIEKIFVAHHDRVFRAAFRVTGNASDAEDVLQSVFLRLLRHQHDFGAVEDAGNYLYRAGVNAALDLVRSRKPAVPLDDVAATKAADPSWVPDRQHDTYAARDWLRRAVAQLHPTAAEMFALRYFEGFDNAEVARLMNTSEGTVAVTLHRTRARLQREIRSYTGEVR